MPTVLLIRHGETDYVKKGRMAGRLPGVSLNEHGQRQAEMVAETLAKLLEGASVRVVYSSPMERTMETAKPIAEALHLDVIPKQGLIEVDIGEWQDKKIKGISRQKIWRKVQSAPSLTRFPGGETFAEAQHRICREIERLCAQHDEKDFILCVSHADPIKLAVAYYLGMPIDMFQRLSISPASISSILIADSHTHLLMLNYNPSFTLAKT